MTEIILENITKTFRGKKVLDDVNLKIESNDVVVFLGPAGSGKTTLFRIIAGTETPDKGKIYFDGQDVTKLPPQKRDVGMVFQTFALYPNLTVYENIASPLRVKKLPEEEIKKQVNEVAELLNIKHILNKRTHECSGGEAQRIVIARALIKKPKIYMFDEPLTNLDYKIRETLRMELKKIFSEVKATVLYSTANPEEAAALGRTLVHIRYGKIIQVGEVRKCYRNPADIVAATYYSPIGINALNAKCIRRNSFKYLQVNDLLRFDVTKYEAIKEGEEYVVGIYPFDLRFSGVETKDLLKIPIEIEFIENMGSEIVITARCRDNLIHILTWEVEKLSELKNLKYVFASLNDVILFSKEGRFIQRLGE